MSTGKPREDSNSLISNSQAIVLDLLSEGEIEGLADGNNSIFFNGVSLNDGNFSGVEHTMKTGGSGDTFPAGFSDSAPTMYSVNQQLLFDIPVSRSITNLDVDDICVTIRCPRMIEQDNKGNLLGSRVETRVYINDIHVTDIIIDGKCTSQYQRTTRINNLSSISPGPWTLKLKRLTGDSQSSKIANDSFFQYYETIINEKILYCDSAVMSLSFSAQQFGDKLPKRDFEIKGILVNYPNNYDPFLRSYTGNWDGITFSKGWVDNPVWIYLDILTNDRYGCGISLEDIDIWTFYNISQYCDGSVSDGWNGMEPRFRCNMLLNTTEDALKALSFIADCMRCKVCDINGQASLLLDYPQDVCQIITNSDVINGEFNYAGTQIKDRFTSVNVQWNDPTDNYKTAIEVVESSEGVLKYGWNETTSVAYGCTSRSQAIRHGRYILYTQLQEYERVSFKASFSQMQLTVGDIVIINDDFNTLKELQGKCITGTTTSLTLDREINLEAGKSYTCVYKLPCRTDENDPSSGIKRITVLNSSGLTNELVFSPVQINEIATPNALFSLNSSTLDEKLFKIQSISIADDNTTLDIVGMVYDENKHTYIDSGIDFNEYHYTDASQGLIIPPSNISTEEYSYMIGQSNVFGMLIGWEHSEDTRVEYYEIQSKSSTGAWENEGSTQQNSYKILDVDAGSYQYRVRARTISEASVWITTTDIDISADPDKLSAVSNLTVLGGSTTEFDGKDCEIVWDYDFEARFKEYFIEVYKGAVLQRSEVCVQKSFIYTYLMNETDGVISRDLNFKVYVRDVYDKLSDPANLTVSNPAPDMSGTYPIITNLFKGLKINWSNIAPADNDLDKYVILLDKNTNPTTEIATVSSETTNWVEVDLEGEETYYVKIVPYDIFGIGVSSSAGNGEPLKLQAIDIGFELSASINMSDSDSNSETTLSRLYDGNKLSNGVSYSISGTNKYVEYAYAVEDIINDLTFWVNSSNVRMYVSIKREEADPWTYFKAEPDHTLDSDGKMLLASSQSDASSNYFQCSNGINRCLFPEQSVARYCRIWFTGNYSFSLYELRFTREIIAEQVVCDRLDALSANLGVISSGMLMSSNYGAGQGTLFDLDNSTLKLGGSSNPKLKYENGNLNIRGSITIDSGDGYGNLSDKPSNLSGINSTEGNKLSGIANGADVTGSNTALDALNYWGNPIGTNYTSAKCTDPNADATAENTSLDALNYTGNPIGTNYTSAKCTDPNADATAENTSLNTTNVGSTAASTISNWGTPGQTTINGGVIATESIYGNSIMVNSFNGNRVLANTIYGVHIHGASIEANHIVSNQIQTQHLTAGCVTADKITTGEIITQTAQIRDATIKTAHIENYSVTKSQGYNYVPPNDIFLPYSNQQQGEGSWVYLYQQWFFPSHWGENITSKFTVQGIAVIEGYNMVDAHIVIVDPLGSRTFSGRVLVEHDQDKYTSVSIPIFHAFDYNPWQSSFKISMYGFTEHQGIPIPKLKNSSMFTLQTLK